MKLMACLSRHTDQQFAFISSHDLILIENKVGGLLANSLAIIEKGTG